MVETFSDPPYRARPPDVQPDFMGRAYEYLIRKLAGGSGESARELFTPTEVGFLSHTSCGPGRATPATTTPCAQPVCSSISSSLRATPPHQPRPL